MRASNEHFVTCDQMKVLERRADERGLSYYQMMENAGGGAAEIIMEKAELRDPETTKSAYVFCGKGNNGGDGFVVARLMNNRGYEVFVILVDGEPKTEDAITNLALVRDLNINVLDMNENYRILKELGGYPDIIVDAIYGTGFKGNLRGNGLEAAAYINGCNESHTLITALDIPSGLGGDIVDEAEVETSSIRAHHTMTFHAMKPVHLQEFAQEYCGEIHVIDIGIDEEKLNI